MWRSPKKKAERALLANERNAQIAGLVRREWEGFPTL